MSDTPGKTIASLFELLLGQFRAKTRINVDPLTADVAITATRILPDNPRRVSLLIVNTGANPIYVGIDSAVSTTRGIYLAANGGSMSLQWQYDFESVTHERYAIASGAPSTIYIEENVLL